MNRYLEALFVIFAAIGAANFGLAHEGHDKTPGASMAPHGGVLHGTAELYFELVNEPSGLKIFPMTHDMKTVAPADLKATAQAILPKKGKAAAELKVVGDHFETTVDAKGAHRYTLELSTTYKGKKETVKFQVEPQS